ncbi:hypothetical protein MI170_15930 [Mycolicibacterium goodii]|uniref:hypothetical protein n=1 Tax=Mycolicibacterium goodii TaxID=134601 RepID=UPI001F049CE3|nr:hypothetical protein [Mycolicibacterium goodii]ULN44889.1 hypothetical protein MI170_15930 [Mycolicibacterium goodii]
MAPALVKGGPSVSHGDMTFYNASRLAPALTDPDIVREMFDVLPEELLIEEIRQFQPLQAELLNVPPSDAAAIVRAAVRV